MASKSGDRVDLFAAGLGCLPVTEQSAPEVSEDTILVSDARNGDRAAFGRLYDRYSRMVHGILLAKVPVREVDAGVKDVFWLPLRRCRPRRETRRLRACLEV